MCPKMFRKVFVGLALLMGILVSVLPSSQLMNLAYVSRFFEVQLPILATGALIKFLMCQHNDK